jgi:hypothetical protein
LFAIGCAAVVNPLACFHLKNCGAWIAAAARQIAGEPDSHRGSMRLGDLLHTIESQTRLRRTLWEQALVAIGCAAVVNRLARFHLKNCGVWIAPASRTPTGDQGASATCITP